MTKTKHVQWEGALLSSIFAGLRQMATDARLRTNYPAVDMVWHSCRASTRCQSASHTFLAGRQRRFQTKFRTKPLRIIEEVWVCLLRPPLKVCRGSLSSSALAMWHTAFHFSRTALTETALPETALRMRRADCRSESIVESFARPPIVRRAIDLLHDTSHKSGLSSFANPHSACRESSRRRKRAPRAGTA